jgi:hypothetical protein
VVEEGVRRVTYTPTRVLVISALVLAIGSLGVVGSVNLGKWLDWFIALTATTVAALLAVAGGIWLFHYQDRENDRKLRTKLLIRLAVESQVNLERLESLPTPFVNERTGEEVDKAVAAELSTVALSDFIRSAEFDPEEVMDAMRWGGRINVHNNEVTTLLAWRGGTVTGQSLRVILSELKERQTTLAEYFRVLLGNLREEGIEPPG